MRLRPPRDPMVRARVGRVPALDRRRLLGVLGAFAFAGAAHAVAPAPHAVLGGGSKAYFANDGASFPLASAAINPQAVYDATSNRTWMVYEAFRNGIRCVALTYLDHTTRKFGPEYLVAALTNVGDDHGAPAIELDYQGYLHVFYDGHSFIKTWTRHAHSAKPRDPTAWVIDAAIPSPSTYPHPYSVGSGLYVFYRSGGDDSQLAFIKSSSLSGGLAQFPSALTVLVNWGGSNAFYQGYGLKDGTDIYHVATDGLSDDTAGRQSVYCFVQSTIDDSVRNVDGSVTISAASLPIDKATADASFRLVSQSGAQVTNIPGLCKTPDGRLHLFYLEGTLSGTSWNLQYKNYDGSSWSTPVTITTTDDRFGFQAPIALPDSSIELYHSDDPTSAWFRGGNMVRFVRTPGSGGTWGAAQRVLSSGGGFPLYEPSAVRNGVPDARIIFTEATIDSAAASSNDPSGPNGLLKLYVAGDSGIKRPGAARAIIPCQDVLDAWLRKSGGLDVNGYAGDFTEGGFGQSIARSLSRAPGGKAITQGNPSGQPTWVASPGYASFNGSQGLASDIIPGTNMTLAACFRAGGTGNQLAMGVTGATNGRGFIGLIGGVAVGGWGALSGSTITTGLNVAGQDIVLLLRANGTVVELWMGETLYYQGAISGAPAAVAVLVGGTNNNGTSGNLMTGRMYRPLIIPAYLPDALVRPFVRYVGRNVV